jgi:hypothetical protein
MALLSAYLNEAERHVIGSATGPRNAASSLATGHLFDQSPVK